MHNFLPRLACKPMRPNSLVIHSEVTPLTGGSEIVCVDVASALAVVPDRGGIGVFSPRLDGQGCSVRGVEARIEFGREFGFDVADQQGATLLASDFSFNIGGLWRAKTAPE